MVKKKANKKQASAAADDDDWEALLEQEASKNQTPAASAPAETVQVVAESPAVAVPKVPEAMDAAAAFLASQGLAGEDGEKAAASKKKKKKKPAQKAGGDDAPATKKVSVCTTQRVTMGWVELNQSCPRW
jgi:hypothetical protein